MMARTGLPAGYGGSILGVLAGIVLLLVFMPRLEQIGESQSTSSASKGVPILGGGGADGSSDEIAPSQSSLSQQAVALRSLALTQIKTVDLGEIPIENLGDWSGTLKLIQAEKERAVVLRECLAAELVRVGTKEPKLSTVTAFFEVIESMTDPAEKCLCLSELIELRSYVKSESGEPSVISLIKAAKATAAEIKPAPWHQAWLLSGWGLVYGLGGFIGTNLVAALLSEVGKQIAKTTVPGSPEDGQPKPNVKE